MRNTQYFANRPNRTLYMHDGAANYIVAFILQLILQLLFTIVLMSTMTLDERTAFSDTYAYRVILIIVNELSIGLTPLFYSKVLGQNYYLDMGFKKKLSIPQIGMLIAIAFVLVVAFLPLAQWVFDLLVKTGYNTAKLTTLTVSTPAQLVIGIILFALVPAILEETLYRGMIARAFKKHSFVLAIFVGGLLFALMHASPVQLVHQFFLGCICCVVYFATASIYAPIIIHFVNNLIAVVGSYLMSVYQFGIPTTALIIMFFVGLILLVVAMLVFMKMCNKKVTLKTGFKNIEAIFSECFMNEEEKALKEQKEAEIKAKIEATGMEEVGEVYLQTKETIDADEKSKGNKAIILAVLFALAVLVINTITGYIN
ncbi:MAG: CPBP family intramembrane metalloprotease [Clostridia bacterium]|nr:CPBP family intramembrane metalloprotease [Clostridia bacterium]